MTLTQLQYIVTLARLGNFRQAAKASFVTQPTLSMQIQKLEDHLGVQIFDRSRQPIRPTDVGQKLIEAATHILLQAKSIQEIADEDLAVLQGDYDLGVIPTMAPYIIPLFAAEFTAAFPKVNLNIHELQTSEIIYRLKSDQLDGGILATPLHDTALNESVLGYETFFAYVEGSDPLARKSKIAETDLPSDRIFLLNEGHCMRTQVLNMCKIREQGSLRHGLDFQSGSIETLVRMVDKCGGYTIVPYLAKEAFEKGSGKLIPIAPKAPVREISLISHRAHIKKRIFDALFETIKEHLPAEVSKMKPRGSILDPLD